VERTSIHFIKPFDDEAPVFVGVLESWNGEKTVEEWSDGKSQRATKEAILHYSITPLFHYSRFPAWQILS
jgi:hypothetical protein